MSRCECAYRFCGHQAQAVQASTTIEVVGGRVAMCVSCADSDCADWADDIAMLLAGGLQLGLYQNTEAQPVAASDLCERFGRAEQGRVVCLREAGHRGDCDPCQVVPWFRDRRALPAVGVIHWDTEIRTPRTLVS